IILCAGKIDPSNLPIGTNVSNATIPVNGKPVIAWILDDLMCKQVYDVIVVAREEDKKLQKLLTRVYAKKMQITIACVSEPKSILESLSAGLEQVKENAVQVILGDTLIRDSFDFENDTVYVGEVKETKRWCLAIADHRHRLVELIDKQDYKNHSYQALAGYYFFTDTAWLKDCVERSRKHGEKELSAAIRLYMQKRPIQTCKVEEWYDFGHIDNLLQAKQRLLRPRYFNQLKVNPVLKTISKVSDDTEKLADELNWYLQLPDELKVLTPRILHQEYHSSKIEIVQEYYGYPTLAELYVYSDFHHENWQSILRHILKIHQEFRRYTTTMPNEVIFDMYVKKTEQRLNLLQQSDPFWKEVLQRREIIYNGKIYENFWSLKAVVLSLIEEMQKDFAPCVMHGDLCFSNILYDVANQIVKIIDPRGSFGRKGIYGDPRYDMAKLRHSVAGLYDFMVADMFQVNEDKDGFTGEIFDIQPVEKIIADFDQLLEENGYNVLHIKLIEGLLFISMLPLHRDHPKRQLMMFLTGIARLNEVKECRSQLLAKL
ncbi:MAG: sugar phosphate nucleotidyltransferase, partial [Candidatus Thermochlorobacter sp.]